MNKKAVLMQGNEACVHGAIYAGMKFYSGYPITPSTEIAEISAELLPFNEGAFIQMEDEIAGIAAAIGASLAGKKSMTATSGPGFSLKQENIGYAVITQTPIVIVNVMRGGPSTGLPTLSSQSDIMQAKWGSHGDSPGITLCPWSVEETFELTVRAFNLSEKYRTPVMLLTDEIIGHSREAIVIPEKDEIEVFDRLGPKEGVDFKPFAYIDNEFVPRMSKIGDGYRYNTTGLFPDENGFPTSNSENAKFYLEKLHNKINLNYKDICDYEEYFTDDSDYLIVAYGSTARSAISAIKSMRKKGIKAGLFRPKTIWPSPNKRLIELAKKSKHILVSEMNLGQYFLEIERIVSRYTNCSFFGRANGELMLPIEIEKSLKEIIDECK